MYVVEIVEEEMAGYKNHGFRWECGLCDTETVTTNLSVNWVIATAINHLMNYHHIMFKFLEIREVRVGQERKDD